MSLTEASTSRESVLLQPFSRLREDQLLALVQLGRLTENFHIVRKPYLLNRTALETAFAHPALIPELVPFGSRTDVQTHGDTRFSKRDPGQRGEYAASVVDDDIAVREHPGLGKLAGDDALRTGPTEHPPTACR